MKLNSQTSNASAFFEKKKNAVILFAVIIFLQLLLCIFSAMEKRGLFIDEIYSFGLSNSTKGAFLNRDITVHSQWLKPDRLSDYLTVQEGERFSYKSVYSNQVKDVHPPLFYFALHTVCSFFPGSYSKWCGITLNIFLFVLSQILLCKISMLITRGNVWLSAAVAVLYGSTFLAIDNTIYIRMYCMLTVFVLLSSYLILEMFNGKFDLKRNIFLILAVYAGCMTQYYMGIFAFFISSVFCLYLLCSRKFKELLWYAGSMFLAVGAFLLTYPAIFDHLFGGGRVGNQTLDNAMNVLQIPLKCIWYVNLFFTAVLSDRLILNFIVALILGVFIVLMLTVILLRDGKNALLKMFNGDFCILAAAVILIFVCIACLSFDAAARYMFFIYPLITLLVCVFFTGLLKKAFRKYPYIAANAEKLLLAAAVCMAINCTVFRRSPMLYNEEFKNCQMLSKYKDHYGIFVIKKDISSALTQECRCLMLLKGIYCVEAEKLSDLKNILAGKKSDKLIVWIDKDKYWSSGYDPEKIKSAIIGSRLYTQGKKLYSYGLVDCYIFN